MEIASYSGKQAVKPFEVVQSSPFIDDATEPLATRVHQLFEAWAVRTPDAPAIVAGGVTVTYAELNRAANRLARHVRDAGAGPDAPVGICLDRSAHAITAILAVLKAGAAYLPLDPAYPAERLLYMLGNSGAPLLITTAALGRQWPAGVATIRLDDPAGATTAPGDEDNLPPPAARDGSDPLAYLIYTSGSTGRPKGVAMAHAPLLNLLRWQARACPLAAGGRVLQFAPLSFDVSFQEIFSTLGEGGTLLLISEELRRDPAGLLRFLDSAAATRVFLPPVMLHQLAAQCATSGVAEPTALREVITAGEALRITPQVAEFFARLRSHGETRLHNHYGPTETHVATAYTLPPDPATWPPLPSIGRPIDGVEVRLLHDDGSAVAVGEAGALYLGGSCLARGYVNDPVLTEAKFVVMEGARWYRTGDLAQRGPDDNLQFLGRADDQVKIRGFRVELGEIEAVLSRHPAIREAAAGPVSLGDDGAQEIVGYLVPCDPDTPPTGAELRRWLLGQLPDYLVPTRFAVLGHLPLTPSGKLDRRALARFPASPSIGSNAPAAPPRTTHERTVARVWEETLGLSRPGIHGNFFELGGTSISAVRVHTALCAALGREFPIAAIFQHPTIAGLAAYLDRGAEGITPATNPGIQDRARRQQQQQQAAAAARRQLAGQAAKSAV